MDDEEKLESAVTHHTPCPAGDIADHLACHPYPVGNDAKKNEEKNETKRLLNPVALTCSEKKKKERQNVIEGRTSDRNRKKKREKKKRFRRKQKKRREIGKRESERVRKKQEKRRETVRKGRETDTSRKKKPIEAYVFVKLLRPGQW